MDDEPILLTPDPEASVTTPLTIQQSVVEVPALKLLLHIPAQPVVPTGFRFSHAESDSAESLRTTITAESWSVLQDRFEKRFYRRHVWRAYACKDSDPRICLVSTYDWTEKRWSVWEPVST